MIRQEIGNINGKPVYFLQAKNKEEAENAGFPKGLLFAWEIDGKREYSPAFIQSTIMKSAAAGKYKPLKREQIKKYYQELRNSQQRDVVNHLLQVKARYIDGGGDPANIEFIDKTIKNFENNFAFPGEDGVFQPSQVEFENLTGANLNEIYSKKRVEENFSG